MLEERRADILELTLVPRANLERGKVVLQHYRPELGQDELGNSLRVNQNGCVDVLGGAGHLATFELEPHGSLDENSGKQWVRLKSTIGDYGYLHIGPEQRLLCEGKPAEQDTLFEVTWYTNAAF